MLSGQYADLMIHWSNVFQEGIEDLKWLLNLWSGLNRVCHSRVWFVTLLTCHINHELLGLWLWNGSWAFGRFGIYVLKQCVTNLKRTFFRDFLQRQSQFIFRIVNLSIFAGNTSLSNLDYALPFVELLNKKKTKTNLNKTKQKALSNQFFQPSFSLILEQMRKKKERKKIRYIPKLKKSHTYNPNGSGFSEKQESQKVPQNFRWTQPGNQMNPRNWKKKFKWHKTLKEEGKNKLMTIIKMWGNASPFPLLPSYGAVRPLDHCLLVENTTRKQLATILTHTSFPPVGVSGSYKHLRLYYQQRVRVLQEFNPEIV